MRVPLVGESYALSAPGAAAQLTVNLFPQVIDDPNETQKGRAILRSTPGAHLFATLPGGKCRGVWSGGGRLFAVGGSHLYEVDSSGTIVPGSDYDLFINDGLPVQMFGNGTQLGIVNSGFFYIDNGSGLPFPGPQLARFQLNGVVTIVGAAVTWVAGDKFTGSQMAGINIVISGLICTISGTPTTTTLNLTSAFPGSGSGICTTFPANRGRNGELITPVTQVFWNSGTTFSPAMAGLPITINGVVYKVGSVLNQYNLFLTDDSAGIQAGVAYSAVQANLVYSAAGGDPVTALTGAFLDGSFFVQRDASLPTQINYSGGGTGAISDGTIWNARNFFTKEGDPTAIQSILADHELLYVLGIEESEVWQNDPNTGRPVRLPGMAARQGSVARWGSVAMDETLYFISGTPRGGPVAYRLRSSVPERISTHAVEQAWATQSFSVLTAQQGGGPAFNGTAYAYTDQGHKFWVVNFAGAEAAWVYDATASAQLGASQWHQRRGAGGGFPQYRFWFHTFLPEWQKHIVGDVASGKLFELNQNFGDEEGQDIKCIRTLPWSYNSGNLRYYGRMTLEMATGLTASTTVEPVVTRDYSDDRGHNYINPQTAGTGLHSDYSRRVYWPAGGSSRGRAWRFTISSQLPVSLIALESDEVDGLV